MRVLCDWEEACFNPKFTLKELVSEIWRQRTKHIARSSSSSSSSVAQPAASSVGEQGVLDSVVEKVLEALKQAGEEEQEQNPRFNHKAIISLVKQMKLTVPHSNSDQKMGRDLKETVERLRDEAEESELELHAYPQNCQCTVFLYWCIEMQRRKAAADAQSELEQPVDPMAAFADVAENRIDQDLLQLEGGTRSRPLLRRLQKYIQALQHDFMEPYRQRVESARHMKRGKHTY